MIHLGSRVGIEAPEDLINGIAVAGQECPARCRFKETGILPEYFGPVVLGIDRDRHELKSCACVAQLAPHLCESRGHDRADGCAGREDKVECNGLI